MTDDLDFVRSRIPGYEAYAEEHARHDSDMRVRAFVGERVSEAQARFGDALSPEARAATDEVLMRCMFTDQAFTRMFEHALLTTSVVAALVHADRSLIELAEQLQGVTAEEIGPLMQTIDAQFEHRRSPLPA